ncbi:MAG: FAD-dependent thymidylate synthase [Rhodoplanes sp.]
MRIFLYDDFPPETSAMIQALYSRSPQSVVQHARRVQERGSDQFMASYYVGYGHASIGDCGVTTLYVEDISLLACKAVQDNPLYSGQETSTRYIDFSKQRIHDPIGSSKSERLLRRWVDFYVDASDEVTESLKERFPLPLGTKEAAWAKAIAARSFDILRGFLPAGVTSQVSWTTNLRQAHEHMLRLETHPLDEVRAIGVQCRQELGRRYPSSFSHQQNEEEIAYLRRVARRETYCLPTDVPVAAGSFEVSCTIDNSKLEADALELIATRPRKSSLPKSLARFGQYRCRFLLDFGSFRDLQRHRAGLCRMPLLTPDLGFNSWYLDQVPEGLREKATVFVDQQCGELRSLVTRSTPVEDRQYFCPLGANVSCELIYDLPQMVYVAELRSSQTVHPTLRWVAIQMLHALAARHPRLALHGDASESALSIRRGSQDIIDRSAA